MKNWEWFSVSDQELEGFIHRGTNIPMPFGVVPPNGGVMLVSASGKSLPAVFDPVLKEARKLTKHYPIKGMKPDNKDLHLLYDQLQNENVLVVAVDGLFGTGKTSTVMAHACGNFLDSGFKMVITKPHVAVGKSYGHLPGTLDEKVEYEFQSFYQYLERYQQKEVAALKLSKQLEIAPLEYIRGRDLPDSWIIIDEAQNLSIAEAITMASRVADGSKLVLLGDSSPWQKDTKYREDGFSYLIKLLQNDGIVGHTEMKTVEHVLRGKVAKALARALMKEGQPS